MRSTFTTSTEADFKHASHLCTGGNADMMLSSISADPGWQQGGARQGIRASCFQLHQAPAAAAAAAAAPAAAPASKTSQQEQQARPPTTTAATTTTAAAAAATATTTYHR